MSPSGYESIDGVDLTTLYPLVCHIWIDAITNRAIEHLHAAHWVLPSVRAGGTLPIAYLALQRGAYTGPSNCAAFEPFR